MPDSDHLSPNAQASARHRWSRRRRTGVAIFAVASLLIVTGIYLHTSTQQLVLADGRRYDVLQFDRNTLVLYDPMAHQWETQLRLKVRYYSLAHDPDAMAAEARALAPVLFHIADSLNLRSILLQPTRPLFTRSFPLLTTSWDFYFVRDSQSDWEEQP